jgi:hypothetical protein
VDGLAAKNHVVAVASQAFAKSLRGVQVLAGLIEIDDAMIGRPTEFMR